jgi:hypothetical protein
MVLSCVDNTPTLAACALACLAFHDLAIPLLYHTVCLRERSWPPKVDGIALFLHGVLASTTDEMALRRKTTYLRHLKALILHDIPRQRHVLTQALDSTDLFPSLHYIEFRHRLANDYRWLFSYFFNIRHVCVRTYESGRLDRASIFAQWNKVKSLTLYNYYANDYAIQSLRDGDRIPLSWQGLSEVTVYPELASHGVILCVPPHHRVPNPLAFMPNPSQFPSLRRFTIMIPKESQYNRRTYEEYAKELQEEQRDLIEVAVGETMGNQWA